MTVKETRLAVIRSQIYISSVNVISGTGKIVNIDGVANRVAGKSFGPKKSLFFSWVKKITPELESAIYRARNVAAPLNPKHLKLKTPCAEKADKCYGCKSPDRICCNILIFCINR